MEVTKVEFWNTPEGVVYYRTPDSEGEHIFGDSDRDIITFVLRVVENFFPDAFQRLQEENEKSKLNKNYYEFRMADDFVRCNFGSRDNLHFDIEGGMFSFEEVSCPRRGICRNEGIICKPKIRTALGTEEFKVAVAYAKGFEASEISKFLGKAETTVKKQLDVIRSKFGLKHRSEIRKVINSFHYNL